MLAIRARSQDFSKLGHTVPKLEYSPDFNVDLHRFRHLLWVVCLKKASKKGGSRNPLGNPWQCFTLSLKFFIFRES